MSSDEPVIDASAKSLATRIIQKAAVEEQKIRMTLQNLVGKGSIVGLECCLKGENSLARKIRDTSDIRGISYFEAAEMVSDVVRYTMVFSSINYTDEVYRVIADLESSGYKLQPKKLKNYWGQNTMYQGINGVFVSPDGQVFELQFHTEDSFAAKNETHKEYERYRSLLFAMLPNSIKGTIEFLMVARQRAVQVPPMAESIGCKVKPEVKYKAYWPDKR